VHIKLILNSLARDKKKRGKKIDQHYTILFDKITHNCLALLNGMSLDIVTGGNGHKRMTNPAKKASISGNYAQILRALTQLDNLKY